LCLASQFLTKGAAPASEVDTTVLEAGLTLIQMPIFIFSTHRILGTAALIGGMESWPKSLNNWQMSG
jgi:hypothetical protein